MSHEVNSKSNSIIGMWRKLSDRYPGVTQFLVFFLISNGVTVLQMVLMPLLKYVFKFTALVDMNFQIMPIGHNLDGSVYHVFDYAKGSILSGGGGGLAYFLTVEITLFIAQVINFFLQRKVTFKSKTNICIAAMWYFIAWIIISIGAAALQGVYKTPIYNFFMNTFGQSIGVTIADIITMLINCTISFWVFFPILKFIFTDKKEGK